MSSSKIAATQLRDFAERYTNAWCSQDPAQVAAFYSPNGALRINDAPPCVGRAAIVEAAQQFMSAFPDLHVAMEELRTDGDQPEYHWKLTGTNTGAGGTGRVVRICGFEKWRFGADGLIAFSQGRFDEEEYRRQLAPGT